MVDSSPSFFFHYCLLLCIGVLRFLEDLNFVFFLV